MFLSRSSWGEAHFEQIATTFLGVHLLTSYTSSPDEQNHDEDEDDDDGEDDTRATSRQTLASLANTERTPLLVPIANNPREGQHPLLRRISGTPSTAQIPPQVRVIRKSSNADLTSTLGINTQAGFLLMATTPPAGSSFGSRTRAPSRGPRTGGRDEERGQLGRGQSYASTRRGS